MLPDGILLWAIILATAIAVFALAKVVSGGERPGITGGGINTTAEGGQAAKTMDRRRSKRFPHRACVFVYSHSLGESPFHEEATTFEVSSHGGLLTLAANVSVGQKLLLTNIASQEALECYVVRFTRKHRNKRDVAIEFTRSAPDFWQTRTEHPQEVF